MNIKNIISALLRRKAAPGAASPEYAQPKSFLRYYREKVASFITENAAARPGQIVFIGDSITDGCDLKKFYPGLTAYNRGIGGDTAKGVYDRLEVSVYAAKPALVVLLIGVNDINNHKKDNTVILDYYEKILSGIKERLPAARVIAQSVYPVNSRDAKGIVKNNGQILLLNKGIEVLAEKFGYAFAPVWEKLAVQDGRLDAAYADDGLHPNTKGYQVVSAYLAPMIKAALVKQ